MMLIGPLKLGLDENSSDSISKLSIYELAMCRYVDASGSCAVRASSYMYKVSRMLSTTGNQLPGTEFFDFTYHERSA